MNWRAAAALAVMARGIVTVRVAPDVAAFDNLAVLRRYDRPLLVLVGSEDRDIPPMHARALYEAASTPDKTLVIAPGKAHTDAMTAEAAIAAYRRLIAGLGPPPAGTP